MASLRRRATPRRERYRHSSLQGVGDPLSGTPNNGLVGHLPITAAAAGPARRRGRAKNIPGPEDLSGVRSAYFVDGGHLARVDARSATKTAVSQGSGRRLECCHVDQFTAHRCRRPWQVCRATREDDHRTVGRELVAFPYRHPEVGGEVELA